MPKGCFDSACEAYSEEIFGTPTFSGEKRARNCRSVIRQDRRKRLFITDKPSLDVGFSEKFQYETNHGTITMGRSKTVKKNREKERVERPKSPSGHPQGIARQEEKVQREAKREPLQKRDRPKRH